MAQIQGREIVKTEFIDNTGHARDLGGRDSYWIKRINDRPEEFSTHTVDADRTAFAALNGYNEVCGTILVTFAPAVLEADTEVKVTGAPGYADFTGVVAKDVPEFGKTVVISIWNGVKDIHVVPRECVTTI